MYRYALATKLDDNKYEVFRVVNVPESAAATIERITNALDSGKPIISMKTSEYEYSAQMDAIWDGNSFTGGVRTISPEIEIDWSIFDTFSFLCDNKIFFQFINQKNSLANDIFSAAFSQEVLLLKPEEDQLVSLGDIWNGTTFTSPE